ncbi:hypothetical protein JOE40_000989 [Arthrobacter sp. PvP102]|jgi:hypothetical protein|uniref:hypothetical protein n=1 Tax=unclassified Arthrobacter TaxID=235627 RepID=UPI001AE6F8C7|nr:MULTISPECIES: hypothetical protein [unclassified Arthrobacter]MBP1231345.1 hypothetical protein [Arthrobacter sp. PvP103]MBP1236480.1 hypothetical protein [Arthrobacter sp. PvP102]
MEQTRAGAAAPSRPQPFLRRWLLWVTLGESAGFLVPAVVAVFVIIPDTAGGMAWLVVAGVAEGTVLGLAQAHVLRSLLPGLSVSRWTIRTAAGAALAWLLGLSPSTFANQWQLWPPALQIGVAVPGALLLLCSIGLAQWPELRRHVAHSGRWVAGNALAWCVGLGLFFAVAPPLWQPGQPPTTVITIGVAAAILMAAGMALVTGLVMKRLLRFPAAAQNPVGSVSNSGSLGGAS